MGVCQALLPLWQTLLPVAVAGWTEQLQCWTMMRMCASGVRQWKWTAPMTASCVGQWEWTAAMAASSVRQWEWTAAVAASSVRQWGWTATMAAANSAKVMWRLFSETGGLLYGTCSKSWGLPGVAALWCWWVATATLWQKGATLTRPDRERGRRLRAI